MTIAVFASDEQWNQVQALAQNINFIRLQKNNPTSLAVDAIFVLHQADTFNYSNSTVPVFINAVSQTLQQLQAPANAIRLNAWNGFLQHPVWELAGTITTAVVAVLNALQKKYILVPDVPGFISARTIAMFINEAYFALEDKVSTKAEINTALQLGASYPYGPFEWAAIIGLKEITVLLAALAVSDKRYTPSPLLLKEAETCPC